MEKSRRAGTHRSPDPLRMAFPWPYPEGRAAQKVDLRGLASAWSLTRAERPAPGSSKKYHEKSRGKDSLNRTAATWHLQGQSCFHIIMSAGGRP